MGGFHALWNLSRHAYLAEVTVTARRGRAIAAFGGSARIGLFAGPAVGGALAGALGLRVPFLVSATLALPALACILLFVRPTPRIRVSRKGHLRGVLRGSLKPLATAGSGQMFAQMIRAGRQVIIPLWGTDMAGLGVQAVGLLMSIAAFVDMCMFVPAGLVMDKLGRKFAIVPCFFIQAVGMSLVPATGGFTGLLAVACLIGMGNGLGSGTMMTMGADLAPPDRVGEFLGLWRLVGDAGSAGSPLVAGALAEALGLVASTFFIAAVGFASASLFAFTVPEPLSKGAKRVAD
jgi:MFS family permease